MPELADRYALRVEPVPVLFAGLLEANGQLGPAEVRPKARWMWRNNLRKAARLGIEIHPPVSHPFNPLLPLRASSLDLEPEERDSLVSALFAAVWTRQLDVTDPAVLVRLAEEAGVADAASLPERATAPEIKRRLRRRTDEAIARGVFGVPCFEIPGADDEPGEIFWGYDDLPYLEPFLAGEDPIPPQDTTALGLGAPNPTAMRRQFRETLPPSWQREAEERARRERGEG
jgi:2-hydroxychromene-2-carboxylate isomerase